MGKIVAKDLKEGDLLYVLTKEREVKPLKITKLLKTHPKYFVRMKIQYLNGKKFGTYQVWETDSSFYTEYCDEEVFLNAQELLNLLVDEKESLQNKIDEINESIKLIINEQRQN